MPGSLEKQWQGYRRERMCALIREALYFLLVITGTAGATKKGIFFSKFITAVYKDPLPSYLHES